jgi:neutral trehalase
MASLQPELGRRYLPAGRRWIFPRPGAGRDHWTIFCWDSFFNALELAVESPELARDMLAAVLGCQYENGNLPNWRGRFGGTPDRSQPPVGAFAVLSYYLRTGDREFLEWAYPYLERWSAWWRAPKNGRPRRDGNRDGLFEWGADLNLESASPPPWEQHATPRQKAAWESGQDDLPNWDHATWDDEGQTLAIAPVDLNAYLVLDFECLAAIARHLGRREQAVAYDRMRRALCDRMNALLWNEAVGMYLDRHWDGRSSIRLAASNFLPLVAGVPGTAQAARMVDVLRDERRFWGAYLVPTISRDDPAFADQQYWRGAIWPPINYLVYHGLRRYGFDAVAAELAASSARIFLDSWTRYQLCRENYDSRTGVGGGHRHQSWGPLLALMGAEELITVTPWDGLRFGSGAPPWSRMPGRDAEAAGAVEALRGVRVAGSRWNVIRSLDGLAIEVNDRRVLTIPGGAVARHVTYEDGVFSARLTFLEDAVVEFGTPNDDPIVTLGGEPVSIVERRLRVGPGTHALQVRLG